VAVARSMTGFRIEEVRFTADQLAAWAPLEPRFRNWPVVYTLDGAGKIYVGESLNVAARFRQHLGSPQRNGLRSARVVIDDSFNKSVCLDLESFLIRLFAGDGQFEVLNSNHGITDSDYYGREEYRRTFRQIFDELRERGAFSRPIREIENTDLFKLSPFKALTQDQAIAVDDILSGLFEDLESGASSRIVIQGAPGTGKTVVGIFLMKLLMDIKHADVTDPPDSDSLLSEFFVPGFPELLVDFKVGMVVPQQSLRRSIKNVFRRTPGLSPKQVLSPFEVGSAPEQFDLLIVDEAHRLNQRAAQAAGPLNSKFVEINERLFGQDDPSITQMDWIDYKSRHQIYLLDGAQAIRPADLPVETTSALVEEVRLSGRHYPLTSQMRVQASDDYVGYVRGVLDNSITTRREFPDYDLRFFDDPARLRSAIIAREEEAGLARLLAGFAWPWAGKHDPTAEDIHVDGLRLRWNTSDVDWVNSPTSINEVGSIHTIQGYDLNYAGVIIGRDLRYDAESDRIYFDRANYHDPRGTTNNRMLGISYSDDDILQFVRNIYAVLLTRGILGTYVFVCDQPLREHLRRFF
jgi:uncharacterized protein